MTKAPAILIIDDDDVDYLQTLRLLRVTFGNDVKTDWADCWETGLEAIGKAKHDIYLVDYRLGSRDGLELITEAKARGCEAPAILLTGQDSRQVDLEAMNAGATDYLVKGEITADMLARSIRYALARQEFLKSQVAANQLLKEKNRRLAELYDTAHQFVDNVSHEFRTPLTVIKEFASILRDGLGGEVNDDQKEYLSIIINRIDDLTMMVNDMLDISKLEARMLAVYRQKCLINEVLDHIRPILERKARANNVSLDIAFDESLPTIYCDPEKIGRVIINLAVNAFKYSSEGGRTKIWARHDPNDSQLVVGVTDDGPGIASENVQVIFERFQQIESNVRASTKGFGLGLSIAKELVQLNFGDITVDSELGKGSTFAFTVPTLDPPRLLDRFLKRAEHFRNGSTFVSMIAARIAPTVDEAVCRDMEAFLQHQLRCSDLVFESEPNAWLLVAAMNQPELDEMIKRVLKARDEVNRNRPSGALPELSFEAIGTWRVCDQRAAFLDCFESHYGSAEARVA